MTLHRFIGILTCVLAAPVFAQGPQPVAFTNANVIPMDFNGMKQGQTVLVRGGRIAEVGTTSQIQIPSDAIVIDCAGQYLVPGLTDAHVHVTGTPLMKTRDDFGDAPIYLA